MKLKLYQLDAFTDKLFRGNPAAVVPLEKEFIATSLMQKIASENNLAETAFFFKDEKGKFHIKWFTPNREVDLCGHATLATSYVVFNKGYSSSDQITFSSNSGDLHVRRHEDLYTLDFPVDDLIPVNDLKQFEGCLNLPPLLILKGKSYYMCVYNNQSDIENIIPNFIQLAKLNAVGVIVTSPGDDCDFVSRFFAPQSGISEDPVTGSAHTMMTPYWSDVLKKNQLSAVQLSQRTGQLNCELKEDRVFISGKVIPYLEGEITV